MGGTDVISAPFTIPDALMGCTLHLSAQAGHVRAYTYLRLDRSARATILPVSVLGTSPQDAVDRLASLVVVVRRDWFSHGPHTTH